MGIYGQFPGQKKLEEKNVLNFGIFGAKNRKLYGERGECEMAQHSDVLCK